MSSEFKETSLKEVADVFTGYPFKSKKYLDDGVLKVLRGLNVKEKEINWDAGAKYWDAEFDQEEYYLEEGDIVIGMDGSKIGLNFAHLKKSDLPAILAQRVARIRAKENISQKYIRYAICNVLFTNYVNAVKTGSSIPHISKTQIENYTFPIPESLLLQEEIAENLAVIDQKIHLNQQTNETLEAIAQATFKSWFVDFDPVRAKMEAKSVGRDPNRAAMAAIMGISLEQDWDEIEAALDQKFSNMNEEQHQQLIRTAELFPGELVESEIGDVPKGWVVKPFYDTIEIIGGGTPKTKIDEYWGGEILWYSVVDAPSDSDVFVIDTEKKITNSGLENSSAKLVGAGTTIISARGTVGKLALTPKSMTYNQSCYGLRSKNDSPYFNFYKTKQLVESLKRGSHGSVFDTITQKTFKTINIAQPPECMEKRYDDAVGEIMSKIQKNMEESSTLTQLRDTLLPKLISGELELN